jgi:uncharacterized membrane protein
MLKECKDARASEVLEDGRRREVKETSSLRMISLFVVELVANHPNFPY